MHFLLFPLNVVFIIFKMYNKVFTIYKYIQIEGVHLNFFKNKDI